MRVPRRADGSDDRKHGRGGPEDRNAEPSIPAPRGHTFKDAVARAQVPDVKAALWQEEDEDEEEEEEDPDWASHTLKFTEDKEVGRMEKAALDSLGVIDARQNKGKCF